MKVEVDGAPNLHFALSDDGAAGEWIEFQTKFAAADSVPRQGWERRRFWLFEQHGQIRPLVGIESEHTK